MIFERFDLVVVPFPFTDIHATIKRPAVVLSDPIKFGLETGQNLMAMVTRAQQSSWSSDLPIDDIEIAGLTGPSFVRLKLFNIENQLVIRRMGRLGESDIRQLKARLIEHFSLN